MWLCQQQLPFVFSTDWVIPTHITIGMHWAWDANGITHEHAGVAVVAFTMETDAIRQLQVSQHSHETLTAFVANHSVTGFTENGVGSLN